MKPELECTSGIVYCARTADGTQWASLNGDQWLPLDRSPEPGDYPDIVDLFDDEEFPDGSKRITVKFARRWLFISFDAPPFFWSVKI